MSKPIKNLIARDLESRYAQLDNVVWVEIIGVDGTTTNNFRRDLRSRDMQLEVIKTSLFKRVCADGPLAVLAGDLEGPAAIVSGGQSAVEVAKLLDEWRPKLLKGKGLRLRGAVLDGEYLDEQRVQELSRMPTKADLQAKVVAIILAPGGNVVGLALSGGGNIVGCLKTMIDKLEKGEEIKARSA